MKHRTTVSVTNIILTLIGLATTLIGYYAFLTPHDISVGGITGFCVILNECCGLPYTVSLVLCNTGLFVWGIKVKGRAYVYRSIGAMIALGVLLDIPLPSLPFLTNTSKSTAMLFGSIITGIGYGLIVSADTSTGGSDLLGMIINARKPNITVGMTMNALDMFVITITGFLQGMETFAFSVVAVLLCNTMIDLTAFCFGTAELPRWMVQMKQKLKTAKPPFLKPIAAVLVVCIFLVLIRSSGINTIIA